MGRFAYWVPALAAVLLLDAACGRHSAQDSPDLESAPAATSGSLGLNLPAPLSLIRNTTAAPYDDPFFRCGYDNTAPLRSVYGLAYPGFTPGPHCGIALRPGVSGEPPSWQDAVAYATYRFDGMETYEGDPEIRVGCQSDEKSVFVALGNFETNSWDWSILLRSGRVEKNSFAPYTSTTGILLALVLSTDATNIEWVLLGDSYPVEIELYHDRSGLPIEENLAPLTVSFTTGFYSVGSRPQLYDFDYDGDGTFDAFGDTDGVSQHVYSEPGTYTCSVRAMDDEGQVGTDSVDVIVFNPDNEAPVARLETSGHFGAGPMVVAFYADSSTDDDRIVEYRWDLGSGSFGTSTGTSPTLTRSFGRYGPTEIRVQVVDIQGETDEASVIVQVTEGWRTSQVSFDQVYSVMELASCGSGANQRPALAYVTNYEELKFVRAADAFGEDWDPPVGVHNSGGYLAQPALATLPGSGTPVIAFGTASSSGGPWGLSVVTASTADGSAWQAPLPVDNVRNVGGFANDMAIIDGRLALASAVRSPEQSMVAACYYADDGDASSFIAGLDAGLIADNEFIDRLQLLPVQGSGGEQLPLLLIDRSQGWDSARSRVFRSGTPGGTSTWYKVVDIAFSGSLLFELDTPALLCSRDYEGLARRRAAEADGELWIEELESISIDPGPEWTQGVAGMGIVGGRPAIAFHSGSQLWYAQALDSGGQLWGAAVVVASGYNYANFAVVNGNPVICSSSGSHLQCWYLK